MTFLELHGHTYSHLLPDKHHVPSTLKTFFIYVQKHFHKGIKTLRSDNDTEFINASLSTFLTDHGVIHQKSCPYTPPQNAWVERKHQHLLEVSRSIYFQAHFPIYLWGYCILSATYLINKIPSKLIYKSPPSLDHLKIIGCQAFVHNHTSNKFTPRAIPTVLLGYSSNQKGYLLYDMKTPKVLPSRHVTFDETVFPFTSPSNSSSSSSLPSYHFPYPFFPIPSFHFHTTSSSLPNTTSPTPPTYFTTPLTPPTHTSISPPTTFISSSCPPIPPPPHPPLRTSTRTKTQPSKFQDFQCQIPPSLIHNTLSKHHLSHTLHSSHLSPSSKHYINSLDHISEPTNFFKPLRTPDG